MIHYLDHKNMGHGQHGWLDSYFHFSFAEYWNPENIRFGVLRVWNDDTVLSGTGFPTHPHQDMEIVSYVVEGELSHADSMGNQHTLTRGQSQYMSAGTGVTHSEFNWGEDDLRFMQIWVLPDREGYQPNYGDHRFIWEDRINTWLPIATSYQNAANNAPIKIHADVNMYATMLSQGESLGFKVGADRQAYLTVLEGEATIEGVKLFERDSLEVVKQDIGITADKDAHIFIIEMAFDEACYKQYGNHETLENGADLV
ncbi:MAG: pirin family protein [Coriobacteriaceae bacterium]|nr:pirin family protein [Coriobacteriaceae bacterium]